MRESNKKPRSLEGTTKRRAGSIREGKLTHGNANVLTSWRAHNWVGSDCGVGRGRHSVCLVEETRGVHEQSAMLWSTSSPCWSSRGPRSTQCRRSVREAGV